MSVSDEQPSTSPAGGRSLLPLRIAAAIGSSIALILVVIAFTTSIWLGLLMLFVAPSLPMILVLLVEAVRRR